MVGHSNTNTKVFDFLVFKVIKNSRRITQSSAYAMEELTSRFSGRSFPFTCLLMIVLASL